MFLGRLAVVPSTLVAVAAGSSGMARRGFLVADGAGAALSMGLLIGAGYMLGHAYEGAGPVLTGIGLAALAGMAVLIGRQLRKDAPTDHEDQSIGA